MMPGGATPGTPVLALGDDPPGTPRDAPMVVLADNTVAHRA
jgi:hypothetical protein